ncbi:hypothetical protein [Sphingomonas cavernae]|uniref:hypothetical protein n=1 Tax=Sphingomonas cavernae TaxID=2320861 RepID=UPI001EE5BC5D|nr:hypothetical protein [Sphingomonas cavernae]
MGRGCIGRGAGRGACAAGRVGAGVAGTTVAQADNPVSAISANARLNCNTNPERPAPKAVINPLELHLALPGRDSDSLSH